MKKLRIKPLANHVGGDFDDGPFNPVAPPDDGGGGCGGGGWRDPCRIAYCETNGTTVCCRYECPSGPFDKCAPA